MFSYRRLLLGQLFFLAGFFVFVGDVFASTYYIDPVNGNNGTAEIDNINKPYQTWAGVTWAAGNSYLQKRGTTASETVTIGASGTSGNEIILGAYGEGNDPIIDGGSSRANGILNAGYDYINISNFTLQNITTKHISFTGTTDYVNISNITTDTTGNTALWVSAGSYVTLSNSTINQATQYAVVFWANTTSTISGCTFVGTVGKSYIYGIYLYQSHGTAFSSNTFSNWIVTGAMVYLNGSVGVTSDDDTFTSLTGGGKPIGLVTNSTITIDGLTANGAALAAAGIQATTGSNVTISNSTINDITGNSSYGIQITSGNLITSNVTITNIKGSGISATTGTGTITSTTVDITSSTAFYFSGYTVVITSSTASNAGSNGFAFASASIATSTGSTAYNNAEDGFNVSGASTLVCQNCTAYNNGSTSSLSSGDGFTAHAGDTLKLENCVGYGNYKSGVAVTQNSGGYIYNSTFYNNYEDTFNTDWTGNMGIGINSTSTTWTITNNITQNHEDEILISDTAITGGVSVNSDYNLFYDTRSADFSGKSFHYNGVDYNFSNYKTNSSQDANSLNSDPLFTSTSTNDFTLNYLSPAIDAGTTISGALTTDINGNPIYGTRDLGAYEYQPPFTLGTDEIDISGNVRVYANGKFRNTTAVSGITADMSITPVGGSFPSNNYNSWLDLNITSWETSGNYNKTWTASSSIATTTIYTVGDLAVNTYYVITLDGATTSTITGDSCVSTTCLSDGSGQLIFTYSGGYSSHDFALTKYVMPPSNIATSTIGTSSIVITWTDSYGDETGFVIEKSTDNITYSSVTTTAINATSTSVASLSVNTQYWFRVAAVNGSSTSTYSTTTVGTYTLANAPSIPSVVTSTVATTLNITLGEDNGATKYLLYDSVDGKYLQADGTWSATTGTAWMTYSELGNGSATSTIGLTANSNHTIQVRGYNGDLTETAYTTGVSSYTLANAPTSPNAVQNSGTKITVSWNQNSNPGGTYFYVSDASGNTGWITSTTTARTGLSCGSVVYIFTIKAKNGDGVETSSVTVSQNTANCSGGGGSPAPTSDTTPPTNCAVIINNNASAVTTTTVVLTLGASDASSMMVSNDSSFTGASWEEYKASKNWTLTTGAGTKTVYAKFRDASNNSSSAVSDTIILEVAGSATPTATTTPATTPTTDQTTTPSTPATGATTPSTGATTPATGTGVQTGTSGGTVSTVKFTKELKYLTTNVSVKTLQTELKKLGYFTYPYFTTFYGAATKAAMVKYQKANGLKQTGNLDKATMAVLNGATPVTVEQTTPSVPAKYTFTKYLAVGYTGTEVKQLQIKLKEMGYLTISPTSYFGSLTKAAVMKLQKDYNLSPVAGFVGPGTRKVLNGN